MPSAARSVVRSTPNSIVRPFTEPSIVLPEPRLVDKPSVTETTCEPPPDLYVPPTPLVPQIDKLVTRHIPKQQELDKIMKKIQKKIIHDYNLPLDANKLRILQETDPYFKPIYDYLAHDILPSKAKSARSIRLQSEQYILCNGLLFRLCINENANKLDRSTLQLVVPETIVDTIISKYHDNLLSNHQGVMRTYLTIRKTFYFRNMFQRISNYVQACLRCQQFRGKTDKLRQYFPRIPDSYRPFDRLSMDFKTMPTSVSGFKHLMVLCDEITRFVICVPLKTIDAQTICEALIQKVVALFGPPSLLITDAATSLTGKLLDLLCKTLGIEHKTVSVCNHGSLQVERHIRTLSNFLKVNLNQFGNDWVRFVPTVCYAYNSFSSSHLGDHSPFELVFGRKPADLTKVTFDPISGLAHSYQEYVTLLKQRFDHLSRSMLELQKSKQISQNVKVSNQLSKSPMYTLGQLVYLYKPTSSAVQSNSRKINAEWCGPLVIHQVLDRTHYLLSTLNGEVLHDVFHFNRLKPCYLHASNEKQNITTINKLKKVLQNQKGKDSTETVEKLKNALKSNHKESDSVNSLFPETVQFCDENRNTLKKLNPTDVLCVTKVPPIDLTPYINCQEANKNLASPNPLSHDDVERHLKYRQSPKLKGFDIIRARYSAGHLQVLLSLSNCISGKNTKNSPHIFWWNVDRYSGHNDIIDTLLELKVQITGSPERILNQLFSPRCQRK